MTKILLIRHALTDTAGKILSGRMPGVFLNEKGRDQLKLLEQYLSELPISAVYCSPLERALETAVPIARSHQLTCIISEDFLEIDFGNWTNHTIEELKNDQSFQLFNTFRSGTRIPGGETMAEAQMRIIKGIEKIGSDYPSKLIAVITHADMIRSAVGYYAGISLDMIQRIDIGPASVSILEVGNHAAKITLINGNGSEVSNLLMNEI